MQTLEEKRVKARLKTKEWLTRPGNLERKRAADRKRSKLPEVMEKNREKCRKLYHKSEENKAKNYERAKSWREKNPERWKQIQADNRLRYRTGFVMYAGLRALGMKNPLALLEITAE